MTQCDNSTNDVWRPRVTVACVVSDGDRYLMVEEEVNGRLAYNQPAGHLDDKESLHQAAVRETREETGWTVELTHLIGVHQWRSSEHGEVIVRFTFAAKPLHHDLEQQLDTGVRRALWLTRREIADLGERLRSPMVLMTIDDWLGGQRLPLSIVGNLMPNGGNP
ncbi:NUDIX hydrolase [Dyella psychrodurans]|uniref:Phosphatase NudJ n=1 Tax=Dyella psychrodurans TaxID=1927960 RepID=A0A370XCK2_9GAMM|nr:NUDIX hydrolase [Dyella psychrodurans]RDS86000.1 NUDIX hydrolase [Dyella psychrodurans]